MKSNEKFTERAELAIEKTSRFVSVKTFALSEHEVRNEVQAFS